MFCSVPKCGGKSVSKGLCDKHRLRLRDHGHLGDTRPSDWGKRKNHPLYGTWNWISVRNKKAGVVSEWKDFWVFVKAVGARPSSKHTIRRHDTKSPYGPDNFFWKETFDSSDRAAYAREWRKNHPHSVKDSDLKKRFGIGVDEYSLMLEAQNGGCGICGTTEIIGRYKYFAVDHCHDTGQIRGLLCNNCNRALGLFQDSIDVLSYAKSYLMRAIWNERPI